MVGLCRTSSPRACTISIGFLAAGARNSVLFASEGDHDESWTKVDWSSKTGQLYEVWVVENHRKMVQKKMGISMVLLMLCDSSVGEHHRISNMDYDLVLCSIDRIR